MDDKRITGLNTARESQGSRNANAVLTEEDVRAIRKGNLSARDFAIIYGVSTETIRRVLRRETWSWLPDEPRAPISDEDALASLAKVQALLAQKKEEDSRGDKLIEELKGESDGQRNPLDE